MSQGQDQAAKGQGKAEGDQTQFDSLSKTQATERVVNILERLIPHPHALRHTAATLAIQLGTSLPAVQARLGHSTILMTSRYLHC